MSGRQAFEGTKISNGPHQDSPQVLAVIWTFMWVVFALGIAFGLLMGGLFL